MALSELYEIGKTSRNTLSGVRKAERRREGGGRLVIPIEDPAEESKNDDNSVDKATPSKSISNLSHPRCMICHLQESKYNCPSCNIPYCSLTCYRSSQHASCSQPFVQKSLRSELGHNGQQVLVDDGERKAMMDVLRRMKSLGKEEEKQEGEDEEEERIEDGEESEEEQDGLPSGIDLDEASVEQLFAMLSSEERARFEAAVEDKDPSQGKARFLLEKLMRTQQDGGDDITTKPWWERQAGGMKMEEKSMTFLQEAQKLSSTSTKAKMAKIEYNIVAVLLAYVYIVRHVDVRSLWDVWEGTAVDDGANADDMPPLEPVSSDERADVEEERQTTQRIIEEKLGHFAPFLKVSGEASKLVMDCAEQVTLHFAAARIKEDAASEPAAKALTFLYKDVESLITQPRLVEVDILSISDRTILALSDLRPFLSQSSQRKIVFYGAYWLRLSTMERQTMKEEIDSEITRLQEELQRAENEERFQAANEAAQQQTVLY